MRFTAVAALPAVLLASTAFASPLATDSSRSALPACADLKPPKIDGVKYLATTGADKVFPLPNPATGTIVQLPACEVNVTLTHGDAGDQVFVQTWLPKAWNGRFQGTGGGGYRAGYLTLGIAPAAAKGYAASSTNAGIDLSDTGNFLLNNATGKVNKTLLTNFSGRSLHEMSVIGKSLTRDFYGKKPKAYWNGCSTGGRQGMILAQKYPEDYDGILAAAPAINWARFVPAGISVQNYRKRIGYNGPICELAEVTKRAVAACDKLDGLIDNIAGRFDKCKFDARTLVGQKYTCAETGKELTFSKEAAAIANFAWGGQKLDGQQVWYGVGRGTNLTQVTGQDTAFTKYADAWIRLAIEKKPDFDTASLNDDELLTVVKESIAWYDKLIGAADPDLSRAHKKGAKIMTWHGLNDQAIPPRGSIDYWERVKDKLASKGIDVDEVYRLFLAPGVQHCQGGTGPLPDDPLAALVDWVENGNAPKRLAATTQDAAKKKEQLCRWPSLANYNKKGELECSLTAYSKTFEPLSKLYK